jgi:phosphotransferase system HPr (HPr) family protein
MEDTRKKYADYKGIPVTSVPTIIPIKGKKELEYLLGQTTGKFEHIGEGTIEDVIEFTRENGKLEGKILMHHDGGDDPYYGFIFPMDSNHNELKENISAGERRKIKLHCKNMGEISSKFKEFIKLREVKHYEKIVEQYARPDYAKDLNFYISEDKDFDFETPEDQIESGNRYAICFDTAPKNNEGLHFRPVASIIDIANKYNTQIALIKDGKESGKNSILGIGALGILKDQNCTVKVAGTDENSWKTAVDIYYLFEKKFGED